MKNQLLVASIFVLLTTGCISTTSDVREFEANDADAAAQYYQLGARYYRNGSYELARERLELALTFDPKMARAHYTLGLTYESLENARLATEHYKLAVRYGPDNYDALNAYAVFLCRQGDYDEAAKQFEKAVKLPENDNAEIMLTNAGVCMSRKPDYERAEKFFREAIRRKPSYGEALIQMSALKHKTGNNLHARAFLQRYLERSEASPAALYLGSQIEENLGDTGASAEFVDQLLQDFPDSAEAQHVRETIGARVGHE